MTAVEPFETRCGILMTRMQKELYKEPMDINWFTYVPEENVLLFDFKNRELKEGWFYTITGNDGKSTDWICVVGEKAALEFTWTAQEPKKFIGGTVFVNYTDTRVKVKIIFYDSTIQR